VVPNADPDVIAEEPPTDERPEMYYLDWCPKVSFPRAPDENNDHFRHFQISLAMALMRIGHDKALEALAELLSHRHDDVRYLGAICLAAFRDPRARPIIEGSTKRTDLDDVFWGGPPHPLVVLSVYDDARWVRIVIQALAAEDLNWGAATILAGLGQRGVKALLEAQNHPNLRVRRAAAAILPQVHAEYRGPLWPACGLGGMYDLLEECDSRPPPPEVVPPLIGALEHEDPRVAGYAAIALGRVRDRRAVGPLIEALDSAYWPLRWHAAHALAEMVDHRAVRPLIVALADENRFVRQAAAMGLGPLRDRRAVEPLIAALKDRWPDVRREAAWALGMIGDTRAKATLERVAEDPVRHVREHARAALVILRSGDMFTALVEALDSLVYAVYQKAAISLGLLGDERAVPHLIRVYGLRDRTEWGILDACPAARALDRLTGATVDSHPTTWYRWWAKNRSKYP